MTQRSNFDSETIIKKLVDHYGLPAFLFSINSSNTFDLNINTKPISVILISYSEYPNLSAITGEKPGIFILEDHWRSTEHIIASKISWHLKLHEKIDARVCSVIEISAIDAEQFLAKNHLMQYAMAKYHYGLIHEKQIYAVASFSHGRKMRRLPEGKTNLRQSKNWRRSSPTFVTSCRGTKTRHARLERCSTNVAQRGLAPQTQMRCPIR